MMFFTGAIFGLLISFPIVIIAILLKQPINRTINQLESKLKAKGKIIEPESSEVEDWVKSLENE